MAIITLLTDFGVQDEYVGALKGVILSSAPAATLVDISHGIDPQDIASAANVLQASYPFFPKGTIHVAIVDPGVGSQRNIIAALCDDHLFLAPDNGLLGPILTAACSVTIHCVTNTDLFRHPVSHTFHGRDIFAPVAAHLSKGGELSILGPKTTISRLRTIKSSKPRLLRPGTVEGQIVAIDHFGNLISNIHTRDLARLKCDRMTISIGEYVIEGLAESYSQGLPHQPLAILGSRNCIEIAISHDHAARILKVEKGDAILVTCLS